VLSSDASFGTADAPPSLLGAAFLVVTAALAASAWVALATAHAGVFSPAASIAAGSLAAAAAAAILVARARRLPRPVRRTLAIEGAVLACAVLAALGLRPSTPWPAYLDAGWYAAAAAGIARHGALWFPAPAVAEPAFVAAFADYRAAGMVFPSDGARGFHAVAFAAPSPGVPRAAPYHPPLLASHLALWAAREPEAVAEGMRYWALAWLLGASALAVALGGALAAPLALALLASGPAWRIYGAQPYAEMPAGALLMAGVLGLVHMGRARAPQPRRAALVGLALGLAALAKVDAVPAVAAAACWWLVARGRRDGMLRAEGRALAAGLALPGAHGLLLALGPTAVYARLNGWGIAELAGRHAVWLAAAAAAALFAWLLRRRLAHLPPAAVAVALASAAALATARDMTPGLAGPPTMVGILSYLMTPLGAFAAIAGLAVAVPPERRTAMAVVRTLSIAILLVVVAPVVTRTLSPIYVARRLVPLALPVAAALAALAALDAHARSGPIGRLVVAGGIVLAIVGSAFAAQPLHAGREFAGVDGLIARLAVYGEADDRYAMPSALGDDNTGRLAAALWALQGREVAVVGPPDLAASSPGGQAVAEAVARWIAEGRDVLWLSNGPPPALPGIAAERLGREAVVTTVLVPKPALPPRYERLELDVTVWRLSPSGNAPRDAP